MPPSEIDLIKQSLERQEKLLSLHMQTSDSQNRQILGAVGKLTTSLFGDGQMGVKGIVKRTEANEEYIEKDKLLKENFRGRILMILFIGTPMITFATSLLFWFITH